MPTGEDPKISACRAHHEEIRRLLDGVRTTQPLAEAAIVHVLQTLDRVVQAHLELEERVLYPALESCSSPILQRKAARYRTHMLPIGKKFIEVCHTWSKPGAISADPAAFIEEWDEASGALRMRMESEDEDLYVLAEMIVPPS